MPYESPLHSVHLLRRDKSSLSLNELTDLCSSLSMKVKEEPTEPVEDQGSGEKGEKEVSTVGAEHSTVIPEVKPEPKKKTKNQLEQEILRHEEDVRLQEQLNEEETQRIARDAEIARQLHKEINKVGQERDQIQSFAPMDSEEEKCSEKKGSRKKSLTRKRAGEKQSEESTKRQKIKDDIEKEELKAYLDLVPREEFAMEIESL
ncbi:hypothetical protein Tco_0904351, partial [Tanacetum coccineum]